ncbi:MAG: nicotinate-nucleotide--dimethylbenzimidazole phosphoribosyltransferase [Rhodospirillales bacterium]|nr:nicotinate-nucleotide--dimethylbenzimidazole phosphoribosyltransferase [Rhodospirillales bacterium]
MTEIRRLLETVYTPDGEALNQVAQREPALTKPAGSLGRLEDLTAWLAGWQGRYPPRLAAVAARVFAGNHGIAERGVSAYPAAVTAQMVENFRAGGAAINQLCRTFDVALRVLPLELERPTGDFTVTAAMSEAEFVTAFAAGFAEADETIDLLCLGEMGIGNTTSAAAVVCGLFGAQPSSWVGPGTGVTGAGLEAKRAVVAAGVGLHRAAAEDGLDLLRRLGGRELAAIAGAVLGARIRRVPVILDGFVASAAAAALASVRSDALDHCRIAHASAEPGHRLLLRRLGMRPLLDLDMRLGEASGAVLAVGLVRAALACHLGMATFEGAGVSDRGAG